jgi:hypothetical protein
MAKKKQNVSPPANPEDPGVASEKANNKLVHTDDLRDQSEASAAGVEIPEGTSATTRHDSLDLGVAMLPGDPDEPVGPEDALGAGVKRGDYRERLGDSGYHPHQGAEPQRPRAEEIGEDAGKKGGVDSKSS